MPAMMAIVALGLPAGVGLLAAMARKWGLPAIEAAALIVLASIAAAIVVFALSGIWAGLHWAALPVAFWAGQASLFVGGVLLRFYRDPERALPPDPHAVVSPADGTVIYVRRLAPGAMLQVEKKGAAMGLDELRETALAGEVLWQIGISMVFTDVHINRAPMAGRVALLRRRPGAFLSLRRPQAASENERQTIVIEAEDARVALVQVASRLVRRIQAFVGEGDLVERGQRIGAIVFGSQVDLFVPQPLCERPLVAPGQHITAGETVVCRWKGSGWIADAS